MNAARFDIHLKPRAKNDRISPGTQGVIDIAVTSPPVDDRANDHLIELIARRTGLPKSAVSIIRGKHGRNKAVEVTGLTKEEALKRLLA